MNPKEFLQRKDRGEFSDRHQIMCGSPGTPRHMDKWEIFGPDAGTLIRDVPK